MLLEQFFYPEGWGGAQITRDLAVHFARLGCRVEVVCGAEQYSPVGDEPGTDPRQEGVRIRRVPAFPGGGDVHSHKVLRHLWFSVWAALRLAFRSPPDLIVAQTNPPPVILIGAAAARLWRRPYLVIAMDVYPEVLFAHVGRDRAGVFARLLERLFDRAYVAASRVVALGPTMAGRIRAKGVPPARVVEIGNWSTGSAEVLRGSANPARREFGLDDAFVLLYAGNLGIGHEFDTLLRGFARAREQVPSLRLVFVGKGTRREETRDLVRRLGLEEAVLFQPPAPARRLPAIMGLADLGVVTLREGFEGLMVPSKLAGYLARGIPALCVGPPSSDAALLVSRRGCGFAIGSGDVAGVSASILAAVCDPGRLAALGHAARRAYQTELDREIGLARYTEVLRECLADGSEDRRWGR